MSVSDPRLARELERLAERLDEPRVREIEVQLSGRLSASLARAYPERALVRLQPALLDSRHLGEVLAHEVAHIVCHWRHGRVAPHGPQWRQIVSAAGGRAALSLHVRDVALRARPVRRARRRRLLAEARAWLRSLL